MLYVLECVHLRTAGCHLRHIGVGGVPQTELGRCSSSLRGTVCPPSIGHWERVKYMKNCFRPQAAGPDP